MKGFAPSMKASGGGLIVNMGSMQDVPPGLSAGSGLMPGGLRLGAAYPTSKVAIYAMSTLLAQELAQDNICVLTLTPGGAASEMHYHQAKRIGWTPNPTPLAMPAKTIGFIATCENPMVFAPTFVNSVAFAQEQGLVSIDS